MCSMLIHSTFNYKVLQSDLDGLAESVVDRLLWCKQQEYHLGDRTFAERQQRQLAGHVGIDGNESIINRLGG